MPYVPLSLTGIGHPQYSATLLAYKANKDGASQIKLPSEGYRAMGGASQLQYLPRFRGSDPEGNFAILPYFSGIPPPMVPSLCNGKHNSQYTNRTCV